MNQAHSLKRNFVLKLLKPLSWTWESIYQVRRFAYDYGLFKGRKFQVPIISIGNLTFGGTGKTPITLWIGEYFNQQNLKVMILMRGYKGKLENSSGIIRSGKKIGFNPFYFGDEALLFARRLANVSVVVGKNRSANLEYYFESEKPDVVLLDDGHQHLKLKRNLNIVLFDCLLPLTQYQVAPIGYLREGLGALKDADIVILTRADQVSVEQKQNLINVIRVHLDPHVKIIEARYTPQGLTHSVTGEVLSVQHLEGRPCYLVAGIASPEGFVKMMEEMGAKIIGSSFFPDHHFYSAEEVSEIFKIAGEHEALVVTTEKDIVKLKRIVDEDRLYYLRIGVDFIEGEKELKAILDEAYQQSFL